MPDPERALCTSRFKLVQATLRRKAWVGIAKCSDRGMHSRTGAAGWMAGPAPHSAPVSGYAASYLVTESE